MLSSSPIEQGAEAKAAFHLRMRAQGVRDLRVLRAFELVPRGMFVPAAFRHLASRDLPLPIECGQTLLQPTLTARMIEALEVADDHRVLEIGSGTGFATAILSTLARYVRGIERFRSLAEAAQARLLDLAVGNAGVVWGDGLAGPSSERPFDRVIVHGVVDDPESLSPLLATDGVLVCARWTSNSRDTQHLVRFCRDGTGAFEATALGPCRIAAMLRGVSSVL